jgi:flagellar biosynthesis/type III secretory pathway protein FliH
VLSRLVLLALKHVFDAAPKRALAEMLPLVWQILDKNTALEMLEVLLRYYVQATRKLDERDIHELLTQTDEEDIMQTFIDRYIEQGKQEGWLLGKQEGWREGRQEGRQEGEQTVLLRLLIRKFGDLTPAQRRRIQRADSETLLR